MRKILSFLFLIVTLTGFSQSVPVASDVSTSFYYAPDAEGVIHLVGTDGDYQNLTYTIVTLPSHGKLFDGSTEITAPGAISGSKVTFKQFNADTDSTAYNETLEPNFIFDGTINFTYNVNDGTTNSSNATVTIKIFDNWHSNATDHQLGADIDGSIAADFLGFSVALNEDGTIMAVGEPKFDPTGKNEGGGVSVYKFNGSVWGLYGDKIEGQNIGELLGSSVSLSGDGSILAAGAPLYDSQKGRVQVYQKAGSSWNKYGTDISSDVNSTQFGTHVRLSSDGSTVAISDIWWGAGGSKVGQVIVYRINGSGVWLPMGDAQSGGQTSENLSWSMDLSSDGNILAVGSKDYDDGGVNNRGKVTVYKYDNTNNEWDLLATIIDPNARSSDNFGFALDMNGDGSKIAIGAKGDDAPSPYPSSRIGTTQIFSIDITSSSPTATLVGSEILGESSGDLSGSFISLDNEGNTVAIGAPRNDSGAANYGHVRLYNFEGGAWTKKGIDFDGDGIGSTGLQHGNRAYLSGDNSVLAIGQDANDSNSKIDSGRVSVFEIFDVQTIPVANPAIYSDNLNEQETTNFITLTGSDTESEDLTYLITSLTDAKIYHLDNNSDGEINESDTPIFSADLPYELTKNGDGDVKVKYNSITDNAVVDFFEFKVVDAKSSSIAAKIQLTITPVNDAPVPTTPADPYQTNEDTGVEITLEGTDVDSTDSELKYIIFEYPANGTLKEGSGVIDSTLPAAGYVLTGKVVTYTPNDNFTKPDSFKFKVKDTGALDGTGPDADSDGEVDFIMTSTDSATVSINVNNTDNDPPVGVDATKTTGEETPITIALSATDPDEPDLTNLKYTIEGLPTNGTIVDPDNSDAALVVGDIVTSNNVKYTPIVNFTDTDSFKFSVTDTGLNGDGSTDIKNSITQATVSVSVTNSDNDPPVPDAGSKTVDEQASVEIVLTGTDPDEPDVSNLKFKVDALPSNGILTDPSNADAAVVVDQQLSSNKVTYTHDGSETGSDEFTFKAIDTGLNGDGLTDIKTSTSNARISITVNPKNDAPVSSNSAVSTNEEVETAAFDLSASDVDDDDTTLIYTVTKLPDNGTLYEGAVAVDFGADISKTLDAKTLSYLPALDFFGEDTITFTAKDDENESSNTATVTFTVANVNDAPIATSEDLGTDENTESADLILKASDVDDDDATLVYTITKLPDSGTLKESGTAIVAVPKILDAKTVTYEPNAGFNGADSFTFTAKDDEDKPSDTATINITVSEFNDPPLATDGTLMIDEDALVTTITLTGSDDETDDSALNFIIETLPLKGVLTDPNDTDLVVVKGAELKGSEVDYKSNPHSNGADSFTFKSKDGGNSKGLNIKQSIAATISVTINPINDIPVAKTASYVTDEELETADFDLEATDPDVDDTILIYTITKLPDNGILKESDVAIDLADLPKILDAKTLSYLPALDFVGDDTIKFSAEDDEPSTSNIATITFTVSNLNDDPIASNESITVEENKSSGNIILLASDVDDITLVYTITKLPDSGVLKESGTEILQAEIPKILVANTVVYTPNASYNGNDSFTFTANDDDNAVSNTGTISIAVTEVNDPPVATNSVLSLEEDEALGLSIVLSGTDPENTSMDAIILTLPTKGVLKEGVNTILAIDLPKTLTGDVKDLKASVVYFPELDYNGDDSFTFKVEDKGNSKGLNIKQSAAATISLKINPSNDPPESDPQTVNIDQETSVDITHVGRDKDLVDVFTVHSQMGKDIQLPEFWGEFIELSADGKTMVIGGWTNNKVKVYGWDGTAWNQLGSDIDGSATGDYFGEYVSISSNGKRIAVGAHKHGGEKGQVRAFDWDGTSWTQLGNEMLGSSSKDNSSYRGIHMSGDGNVIAAASFKKGYVDTYKWDGTSWNKTGVISNTISNSDSPGQVSLSNNGDRLAIGSSDGGGGKGQVKIFDWDGTNTWNQYEAIDGKNAGEKFGNTLSITRDGKKIAIGVNGAGSARVYDLSGSNANQVGADINYGNGAAWRAISLSDDGNRIAIPITNQKTGVFDWNGTSWNKLGEDLIKPPASPVYWGESLDMSSDGKTLVIGGHNGFVQVFNILNLNYIITTYPSNGVLKEGSKTITPAELPYTLKGTDATYVPNLGFYGEDEYFFKLNDGKSDSTNSLNDKREDSKVKIIVKEYILVLPPSNYKITPTETCKGFAYGIIDIEVKETSYKITPSGIDIPINYNITIDGVGPVGTIMSPNKTAQIKGLAAGTYKLSFTVQGQPKYLQEFDVVIDDPYPPIAYPVDQIELCDDNIDGEDDNGKVNFDTSLILNTLLKDPVTGNVQDETLFDIEFTYFDETTSAIVTKATLPSPFYSATQTVLVKFTSIVNGSCEGTQTIDFKVNSLPLFERIEDTISVCSNLDPVTIGVKSSDSKVYTYTWTRNGSPFAPNIAGIDSSILIGKGGEYIVTATSSDGTNCSKSMTIDMKESSIAVVKEKDIVIKDLNAGPNNTITVLITGLGIGDYEYALDDKLGPYQDEPVFNKIRPGIHTVYIRDKNQCGVVKIKINVIGYKKFFTPNGDGIHDTWNIIGLSSTYQAKTKIYIFDRYGKLLKELDPLGLGWDGTYIGNPLPSTDYWFRVQLEDGREFKSHFSLVRPW